MGRCTLLAQHHAVNHLIQERLVTAGADAGGLGHGLHPVQPLSEYPLHCVVRGRPRVLEE